MTNPSWQAQQMNQQAQQMSRQAHQVASHAFQRAAQETAARHQWPGPQNIPTAPHATYRASGGGVMGLFRTLVWLAVVGGLVATFGRELAPDLLARALSLLTSLQ